MHTFNVADYATRFAGRSSNIKRPREITYFSYDENHTLRHDESSLRYYYTPALHGDLNRGYDSFIKHDDSIDEHLDSLLESIIELEKKTGKRSVVKTGFGDCGLIIGGEVDAIWDCKPMNPENPINYVELKTSRQISTPNQNHNFEKKLQRFWAQSFLLGVPKIVIGFRDDNGIITSIDIRETQSIPTNMKKEHLAQGLGPPPWNGNVAINFTTAFLEWLKSVLAGTKGVWRIKYQQRGKQIEVFQVQEFGYAGLLTDRFLAWRTELSQSLSQDTTTTTTTTTTIDQQ
ncbi:hypothetical protein AA313_de0202370 [Arthrobotrys entomopaga]|nr:hypothetical protein AA313_de0202370 [Arthrobotrys entomopaga]